MGSPLAGSRPFVALVMLAVAGSIAACGRGSTVIPETSLGVVAKDWLFAHNRGEGHAMVHFTTENQGSVRMSGAQMDSSVYDGVRFAREIGPLEPVRLVQSTDSSLAIVLRSGKGDLWEARFTPAPQPSTVRVHIAVSHAPSDVANPNRNSR